MQPFLPLLLALGLYVSFQVHAELQLSRRAIEEAVISAKANVDSAYTYSRRVSIERVKRKAASPADIHRLEKQPAGAARVAVRVADYMEYAITLLQGLKARRQKRSINATDLLTEEELQVLSDLTGCTARQRPIDCRTTPNRDRFRTASSVCNNRENTRWGSSSIPFVRWLPAEYQDGISEPKGWDPEREINGHVLPPVREVSNEILSTANSDVDGDSLYTHLLTIWGQLMDHDITFTPHSPAVRPFVGGVDCEVSCERIEPCFPIEIPDGDPRFGSNSGQCIPFFRSAPACGSGHTGSIFGASTVRRQMNGITAFIDGSEVYGSDESSAQNLRDLTTDEGLLKVNDMYTDDGRELLPFSSSDGKKGANMCASRARITNDSSAEEVPCFIAGDGRANENIGLLSLQTLLVREHNRLARALAELNPHWGGERIYQEARKIVAAYLQVITYRDYLPLIVGPDVTAKYLSTYPGYDEETDPSIANVFATAAYRFAHLMVQPFMFRLDEEYNEHPEYPSPLLHKAFFAPWRILFEGGVDPILRGLVGREAKLNTQEHMMHDELREKLFQFTAKLALDLGSLNMQRGRDHGLPGYSKWREFCDLSVPEDVDELGEVMGNPDLAAKLMSLYGTPENIDVWLGGVSEPFVNGGRVGPLFACLIAKQFQKLRQGDRFWWENDGVFTEAQKYSLRGMSLSKIICDNTKITKIPRNPFLYSPQVNSYTLCEDIPAFDLRPWRETVSPDTMDPSYEDHHDGYGPRGPPGPPGPPGQSYARKFVAFSVQLGNDSPTSRDPVMFRTPIYNEQNSYDIRTGYFTCQEPGVYEFTFNCIISNAVSSLDLVRNGKRIVHSFTTVTRETTVASGHVYVRLDLGDRVWLTAPEGTLGLSSDSILSGQLVYTA